MPEYEKQFVMIQRAIQNCRVSIEVVAITTDNRFAAILNGVLRAFVVSQYCNASYTWHSSGGSIMDRGPLQSLPDEYKYVDDVVGGQMELAL
ncbi:hypothetical protein DFQ01_103197 [Paenibacillus cellulosilyticus]|uniref:Uncharacterized protein n=1 Tax=Paenibacillus cellulosilyticus TaxID=375489 RepID=A0A2V2YZM8_9BACL|nr:hypothetical protein [Paenibacillus cellulosilyticus]PWW06295.1 hypothetical protein DFQ01_103197 [Paenibacillus cellulosilyticus]QKS42958.1 hypothetical protein HUB94_00210 [Paenibacillus cellulosilyticus]QKS43481.1 hypothetical protein HUB94_02875 [Paenibacillus cellulosilyticus]